MFMNINKQNLASYGRLAGIWSFGIDSGDEDDEQDTNELRIFGCRRERWTCDFKASEES